ncbi:MAG: phosphotransferase [Nocardioides sp.]
MRPRAVNRGVSPALAELLADLGVDSTAARLVRHIWTRPGDYLVLPGADQPQLMVPCIRAAGVMLRERRARGLRAKAVKHGAAAGLSSGLAGRLPLLRLQLPEPGLGHLVTWITDTDTDTDWALEPGTPCGPYAVGILLGPPRANRKPVLRIFAADGSTWGYAKVGISELTNALVRREADALAEVSRWPLTRVQAPHIRKAGTFGGREVLATSPLATTRSNRQPTALPVEPTRELFSVYAQHDVPLHAAPAMAKPVHLDSREAALIEALADRVMAIIGNDRVPLGASHGDWTPWNLAWTGDQTDPVLAAWDWERAGVGVPQGHDVVHFESAKVRVDNPGTAEADLLTALPARLAACGLDPFLTRHLLTTYLITIGRRYAADLAREPVPPLARRLAWVIDLLDREAARLELDRPTTVCGGTDRRGGDQ